MKRWLVLVLVVAFASSFMLAGCGGSSNSSNSNPTPTPSSNPPQNNTDFYHFNADSELTDFTMTASTNVFDTTQNYSGTTGGAMKITPDSGATEVKFSFLKDAADLAAKDVHFYINKTAGSSNAITAILFINDETASALVAAKGIDIASLPDGWNKVVIPINTNTTGSDQLGDADIVAGHNYKFEFCINAGGSTPLSGDLYVDDIGLEY
jgi:Uncharacterized lipoprotein